MGYHAINEGSPLTVYQFSDCSSGSEIGVIYNGEVFTWIQPHTGYWGNYEIRFRNSSGQYANGYINTGSGYGNLTYSGKAVTESALGPTTCYRFKLRQGLTLVNPNGSYLNILSANDYVYTRTATAGATNPANMYICGYKKGSSAVTACDAFVHLDYTSGSMFNSNFCLYKA
jgi:hypothetical protein